MHDVILFTVFLKSSLRSKVFSLEKNLVLIFRFYQKWLKEFGSWLALRSKDSPIIVLYCPLQQPLYVLESPPPCTERVKLGWECGRIVWFGLIIPQTKF